MFGYVKKALLDEELAKNADLYQKLCDEVGKVENLKAALNTAETRYLDFTSSDRYKLLENVESLEAIEKNLKEKIEEDTRHINEYKKSELEKAKYEIDEKTENYRLEGKKDIERIIDEFNRKKSTLEQNIGELERDLLVKSQELIRIDEEIKNKKNELLQLESEIETQEELNTIRPVLQTMRGINSSEIKERLDENKERQKEDIRIGKVWNAFEHFYWNDSLAEGKSKQKRLAKFLLTAFNAETDNFIASAKKNNFHRIHKDIEKWFEKINKLGEDWSVTIEREYLKLRLEELRIVIEYHLQKEFEKEEERYTNESIQEEKKVQKEIENFVKAREKEERDYKAAIVKAKEEMRANSDTEISRFKSLIEDLQMKLDISLKEKERAMSLAQLTRSGHVYIISNEGSFGRGVYKIGMTRRLDPMDRVKELGDASVPFFFDVHGIIHSEDAPGLERELHRKFENFRVNKENYRREFFRVPIDEIENAICEIHGQISLDRFSNDNELIESEEFSDEDQ